MSANENVKIQSLLGVKTRFQIRRPLTSVKGELRLYVHLRLEMVLQMGKTRGDDYGVASPQNHSRQRPGTDFAAQTIVTLAAGSIAFRKSSPSYSNAVTGTRKRTTQFCSFRQIQ